LRRRYHITTPSRVIGDATMSLEDHNKLKILVAKDIFEYLNKHRELLRGYDEEKFKDKMDAKYRLYSKRAKTKLKLKQKYND